jgi:hypothetical protein
MVVLRASYRNIIEQFWRHKWMLLLVYLPPIIFLLILTFQRDIPMYDFTADTASIANVPAYTGLVSNLGLIVWGAALAICLFAALLLWRQSSWVRFFIGSAALTLILLLDDKFMIHERLLSGNASEILYVAFYGGIALAYAIAFWRFLRQTDFALLLTSIGLLGCSVLVDLSGDFIRRIYHVLRGGDFSDAPSADGISSSAEGAEAGLSLSAELVLSSGEAVTLMGNLTHFAEDGTKFLGIIGWLLYFGTVAHRHITRRMQPRLSL